MKGQPQNVDKIRELGHILWVPPEREKLFKKVVQIPLTFCEEHVILKLRCDASPSELHLSSYITEKEIEKKMKKVVDKRKQL